MVQPIESLERDIPKQVEVPETKEVCHYGGITWNPQTREVELDKRKFRLTPREKSIFEILLQKFGRPVPRADLENIWKETNVANPKDLTKHYIKKLRIKLEPGVINRNYRILVTYHSFGWALVDPDKQQDYLAIDREGKGEQETQEIVYRFTDFTYYPETGIIVMRDGRKIPHLTRIENQTMEKMAKRPGEVISTSDFPIMRSW